jgi:hypothetical protein
MKPKLESEKHPDYPKAKRWTDERGILNVKPAPPTELINFYASHPEFENEGVYKLICPYCGDENIHEDVMGQCCHEIGHCEWKYFEEVEA